MKQDVSGPTMSFSFLIYRRGWQSYSVENKFACRRREGVVSGGGDTTIPPDFNVAAWTRVISYAILATYGGGVTLILCSCKDHVTEIFYRGQIKSMNSGKTWM